ncbi:MAG: hypothetical protein R3A78_11685 [Polyangiales bacterium]|nr:hypothetical protein [Myxococcales bacterium]
MNRIGTCLAFALGLLGAAGCSCDDENGNGKSSDGGAHGDGSTLDGSRDGDNSTWDGSVGDASNTCAQQMGMATIEHKAVDIIVVIDNSGSMSAEISEVEVQINKAFADILDNANPPIDYRVIMLSRFGNYGSERICVAKPLGGIDDLNADGHCDTVPSMPVNTAKFFHHSQTIGSNDAFCRLLDSYNKADAFNLQPNGYKDVLRPDAFKFILVITDDRVNCGFGGNTYSDLDTVVGGTNVAASFDTALRALSPSDFGVDAEHRNYSFWSIVAQAPYMSTGMGDYGLPVPPSEASTTDVCTPDAQQSGTGYQALSMLTGGYRFPSCGLAYSPIFSLMAQGVIEVAQVGCDFAVPDPPDGEHLDLSTVQVKYSSGDTLIGKYNQVANEAACTPEAFYIENETTIKLCPDLCNVVQADENANVNVLFGCAIKLL